MVLKNRNKVQMDNMSVLEGLKAEQDFSTNTQFILTKDIKTI